MKIKIVFNKQNSAWSYTYRDSEGKRHKKICVGCKTYEEAEVFVSKLKIDKLDKKKQFQIKEIAADMYKENSPHILRLKMFGKNLDTKTIKQKRHYIDLIIDKYGELYIDELNFSQVEIDLLLDSHSNSWKNSYMETFCAIYDETTWKCSESISRPNVQRFNRNSKKADILTTYEITKFFFFEYWTKDYYKEYLLFYLAFCCGLRLGEVRGLRAKQFRFEKKILIVDGFCKNTKDCERTIFNKKGNKYNQKIRVVPLQDFIIEHVKKYLTENNILDNDFLFTRENGKPFRQEYLEDVFQRQIRKARINVGKRKIVPHSLRYTYVTRMRRYLPKEIVKEIVGHTDIKTTDYYTRFGIDELIVKLKDAIELSNTLLI